MEHVEAQTMRLLGTVPAGDMKSAAVHFQAGDVLYGRLRPYLNKVLRPLFEGLSSAEFIVFSPSPAIDQQFLQYLLNSRPFVSFASHLNAGDRPRVDFDQLGAFEIALPPLPEQPRIAAEIEEHLSDLEAAIRYARAAGDRTTRLRSAVLESVFSRAEYPLEPLGTLISSGPQNGIYKPSEAYGTGTAIVRIDDFQDEFLRESQALRRLALTRDELSLYGLNPGDLVINRVNSMTHLGKCFVVPERICPAVFESNMMRLSLGPGVMPSWIALYLKSPSGRRRLVHNAKQAVNQASINQRDVCSTPIPMPRSIAEQGFQLEMLERQLDCVCGLRIACSLALVRAARLRQAILKKAFEGKLVPQDPNDEPASVLLERLRAARAEAPLSFPERLGGAGARGSNPFVHLCSRGSSLGR